MTMQEKFSKRLPINHGSKSEWSGVTPGERFSVRVSSEERDGAYTMPEIRTMGSAWLISLAALVCVLVGILCLVESVTPPRASTDQLRLAAGSEPSQAEITLGQAIQAISVRH